ncbi:MAG: chemotaxis-specific protein-glutamate methyltransferase CheB [Guyparkeria sp.]
MTTDREIRPIRVVIADDSVIALRLLSEMLERHPDIRVVARARDGVEALEAVETHRPDVLCTDLHMPNMDGLELTRQVMARFPCPILVISVSVQDDNRSNVFQLIHAGAVDVLPKPRGGLGNSDRPFATDLAHRVRTLARVDVFRRKATLSPTREQVKRSPPPRRRPHLIAIGASTGGVQAMEAIIQALPADFPVPILYIQHISQGFQASLVSWLNARGRVHVVQASAGSVPLPGHVYVPPEEHHLTIDGIGHLQTPQTPPHGGHRPSIDVSFESVADYFGHTAMGILLTGMGRDGATGLRTIRDAGGRTVAQDPDDAVVTGMPRAAIEREAADDILDLQGITALLSSLARVS